MITLILLGLAVCIALFILVVASRPSHFRITRSAQIAATPATVFAHVNDLHLFQDWSPWTRKEPEAEMNFEGPRAGVGAAVSWRGKKVGEGRMTLTESRASEFIQFRLEFLKPFAVTNTAEFDVRAEDDATTITWSMSGESRFLCKAIGLFVDMDKMCGRDFEQGLENLRAIAENEAGTRRSSDAQIPSVSLNHSSAVGTAFAH
ncbi:MAG: SRPBCC family protein [Verrucomicrobiota bacterium]|nr:SRPBCC family protein [Verrucomicrobiota bacterium]